ncbi:cupin domain-containing protein [Pelagibacteraceae bacterium]|nr:cupin domain-containing protein [Pelagibacteraceae bacterium]
MSKMKSSNVTEVLKSDGVDSVDIINFQNTSKVDVDELISKFGKNKSWAVRVTYNDRFGGVAIQQLPGEGNRLHMHPTASECWVILKGKWKWFIDGKGDMEVSEGSIINVPSNTFHQIKCIGNEPGIRFAVTAPDVEHVYK